MKNVKELVNDLWSRRHQLTNEELLEAAPVLLGYMVSAVNEETMFLDRNFRPICVGHIIRAPITINQDRHGTWGEYEIVKRPGGYVMSYVRSELGEILPKGYTGGYMNDVLPEEEEKGLKELVFTQVPIKVDGWEIVGA